MSVKIPRSFTEPEKLLSLCILVPVFSDMNSVRVENVLGDPF